MVSHTDRDNHSQNNYPLTPLHARYLFAIPGNLDVKDTLLYYYYLA